MTNMQTKVLLALFAIVAIGVGSIDQNANAEPTSRDVRVVNTATEPVPVAPQGTTTVSGQVEIAGTPPVAQSGTWNVGILGTPSVAQSGTWNVGILGTPSVAQSGTWNVNLTNTSVPVSLAGTPGMTSLDVTSILSNGSTPLAGSTTEQFIQTLSAASAKQVRLFVTLSGPAASCTGIHIQVLSGFGFHLLDGFSMPSCSVTKLYDLPGTHLTVQAINSTAADFNLFWELVGRRN